MEAGITVGNVKQLDNMVKEKVKSEKQAIGNPGETQQDLQRVVADVAADFAWRDELSKRFAEGVWASRKQGLPRASASDHST